MTEQIKMPPFTGRLASSPEQPLISEYARLAVEQNTAELKAEVERLRAALHQMNTIRECGNIARAASSAARALEGVRSAV
jgi:hypothetical protein